MFDIKKLNFTNNWKSSFVVLFITAIFNVGYAAEPVIGVAPTVLVEASSEAIPSDLSPSNLPKTMSLGWGTEAEILELKRQLVEFNLVGPKSCMSWLYIRIGEQTRLFMLILVDAGVLRINNTNFESRYLGSYLSATPLITNLHEGFRGKGLIPDLEKRVRLNLGFQAVIKSRKNTTCTFTNVKCRRYEFSKFPIVFGMPVERFEGQQVWSTQLVVNSVISKPVSYFAEDMCPKTSNALIEASTRLRLGDAGEFINSLAGGIPFNRDIKKALMETLYNPQGFRVRSVHSL
jgi:hypothetical protein